MRAQFEVLIFRVTSARYCLISQNRQVVENWRSASRTTDLAAMEITVEHQDDNHEVQRLTNWPVQGPSSEVCCGDKDKEDGERMTKNVPERNDRKIGELSSEYKFNRCPITIQLQL
ncbi:hypothetical protein AVEN_214940-1 [Araneus ventricosus]|uniref:Uncharacterized protein n=1 Tax=Araneus ventricosus TaxID=182803 RepID=A0A4Y2DBH0_ARAVE|nr:hypothetical protein AVEN_214940-1 [Araneus ventricosus]